MTVRALPLAWSDADDVPPDGARARADGFAPRNRRFGNSLHAYDLLAAQAAGEESATRVELHVVGLGTVGDGAATAVEWRSREDGGDVRGR